MRNLKKILALVLALVMSFSLVSVSSAAFKDEADFDPAFVEAAEVLTGLGVIKGRTADTFEPDAPIKRAEVAALIYRVVTGDVDDKQVGLYAGAANFTDVTAGYWGAGYIGFCANGGYIKGYPDGSFKPEAYVNGYEALIMVLRAIGYGKMGEFTGDQYRNNAATRAKLLGITDNLTPGVLVGNATREVVAEVLYRALLVPQVEYTPALNYHLKENSLGWQTFDLYTTTGVVVANEQANLLADADSALADNRTKIQYYDGSTYTMAGTTTLDDLGESRYFVVVHANNVKDRTVLHMADSGLNTVYATGDYKTANALKAGIKAAGLTRNTDAVEFVDFDTVADNTITTNVEGNYVKVIDNDDDGIVDYILKTNYFMDEIYRVSSKGAVTFYDGNGYNALYHNLYYYEGIAAGDIVITTNEIDGNYFCEKAQSFTGVCTKVDYKNANIVVEGTAYEHSAITNLTGYAENIFNVSEKTEYTFYMDKFGYVRIYTTPGVSSQYALLTEAYFTNKNNSAFVSTNTPIVELSVEGADVTELIMSNYKTGGYYFYDEDLNLFTQFGAKTNVGRFGALTDTSVALLTAYEQATDKAGKGLGYAAVDYINLGAQLFTKADKAYNGTYAGEDVIVNAVHDTEYYFVYYKNGVAYDISYCVGYANLPKVRAEQISAAYTVATNIDADSSDKAYWVADVVVIEMNTPIDGVYNTVDLVYFNNSKETSKVYNLSVIDRRDPAADTTIYVNGYWTTNSGFNYVGAPEFYAVYETEGSDIVGIAPITSNYAAHGIYAGTIDRISAVDSRGDYIVLTDGTMLNIKDIPVFGTQYGAYAYETSIEATRKNANGAVLFDGNEGDQIIYCTDAYGYLKYIVLCDETYDFDYMDGLWLSIMNDGAKAPEVVDEVEAALTAIEVAQDAIDTAKKILKDNGVEIAAAAEEETEVKTNVDQVMVNLKNNVYLSDVEFALALLDAAKKDLQIAVKALETAVEKAEKLTAAQADKIGTIVDNAKAEIKAIDELTVSVEKAKVTEDAIASQLDALKTELVYMINNDADAKNVYYVTDDAEILASELTIEDIEENGTVVEAVKAWAEALACETIKTVKELLAAATELKADVADVAAKIIEACK